MRTISIINLKGGCAKTLSSINIAHVLASVHGRRVDAGRNTLLARPHQHRDNSYLFI